MQTNSTMNQMDLEITKAVITEAVQGIPNMMREAQQRVDENQAQMHVDENQAQMEVEEEKATESHKKRKRQQKEAKADPAMMMRDDEEFYDEDIYENGDDDYVLEEEVPSTSRPPKKSARLAANPKLKRLVQQALAATARGVEWSRAAGALIQAHPHLDHIISNNVESMVKLGKAILIEDNDGNEFFEFKPEVIKAVEQAQAQFEATREAKAEATLEAKHQKWIQHCRQAEKISEIVKGGKGKSESQLRLFQTVRRAVMGADGGKTRRDIDKKVRTLPLAKQAELLCWKHAPSPLTNDKPEDVQNFQDVLQRHIDQEAETALSGRVTQLMLQTLIEDGEKRYEGKSEVRAVDQKFYDFAFPDGLTKEILVNELGGASFTPAGSQDAVHVDQTYVATLMHQLRTQTASTTASSILKGGRQGVRATAIIDTVVSSIVRFLPTKGNPNSVSVIFGEAGSGKTEILRAIQTAMCLVNGDPDEDADKDAEARLTCAVFFPVGLMFNSYVDWPSNGWKLLMNFIAYLERKAWQLYDEQVKRAVKMGRNPAEITLPRIVVGLDEMGRLFLTEKSGELGAICEVVKECFTRQYEQHKMKPTCVTCVGTMNSSKEELYEQFDRHDQGYNFNAMATRWRFFSHKREDIPPGVVEIIVTDVLRDTTKKVIREMFAPNEGVVRIPSILGKGADTIEFTRHILARNNLNFRSLGVWFEEALRPLLGNVHMQWSMTCQDPNACIEIEWGDLVAMCTQHAAQATLADVLEDHC